MSRVAQLEDYDEALYHVTGESTADSKNIISTNSQATGRACSLGAPGVHGHRLPAVCAQDAQSGQAQERRQEEGPKT